MLALQQRRDTCAFFASDRRNRWTRCPSSTMRPRSPAVDRTRACRYQRSARQVAATQAPRRTATGSQRTKLSSSSLPTERLLIDLTSQQPGAEEPGVPVVPRPQPIIADRAFRPLEVAPCPEVHHRLEWRDVIAGDQSGNLLNLFAVVGISPARPPFRRLEHGWLLARKTRGTTMSG